MEEGVAVWYRIDMTDVPATQSQVSYKEAGKLSEFGITIDPAQTGYLGQMFYNEEKQKLYILNCNMTCTMRIPSFKSRTHLALQTAYGVDDRYPIIVSVWVFMHLCANEC